MVRASSVQQCRCAPGGEIHVAHKTKEPFSWWGFPDLVSRRAPDVPRARSSSTAAAYQPYANRKARDRKLFCADAVVYVYARDGAGAPPTLPPLASSNGAPSAFFEGRLATRGGRRWTSRRVCRVVRLDAEPMARVRERLVGLFVVAEEAAEAVACLL